MVADGDAVDAVADVVDDSGRVDAGDVRQWQLGTHRGAAGPESDVDRGDPGGLDADPDLAGLGSWRVGCGEVEYLRAAEPVELHCEHQRLLCLDDVVVPVP
ncbi:hypothetical protein GCM10011576_56150 [Micromonospora parathelypteridis]|nr:hypothetical protein GCM10011576_56150 [Micromonospora parathelypteridis]